MPADGGEEFEAVVRASRRSQRLPVSARNKIDQEVVVGGVGIPLLSATARAHPGYSHKTARSKRAVQLAGART